VSNEDEEASEPGTQWRERADKLRETLPVTAGIYDLMADTLNADGDITNTEMFGVLLVGIQKLEESIRGDR